MARIGSNSAVGGAASISASDEKPRWMAAHFRNVRRSALLILPIGFISAELQSYCRKKFVSIRDDAAVQASEPKGSIVF